MWYYVEQRLITKGNELIWARVTGTVIRDENKRPVYGLGMVEDITERKQMEQYLLRIERLAAMGRMTAVLANEDFEVVSIASLVRRTVALLNPSLHQAGIHLTTHIPDDLLPMRVVPDQISQVVLNILGNAIEATPRSGHIEVSAILDNDELRLDFTVTLPHNHARVLAEGTV